MHAHHAAEGAAYGATLVVAQIDPHGLGGAASFLCALALLLRAATELVKALRAWRLPPVPPTSSSTDQRRIS